MERKKYYVTNPVEWLDSCILEGYEQLFHLN
jgi:hypothetical protein